MTFTESVGTVLTRKYAMFDGRARRAELWWFVLFSFLVQAAVAVLSAIIAPADGSVALGTILAALISFIVTLGLLLPSIAVGVRRLHDIDRTGWWMLLVLIPLIGQIVLLVFFCLRGTDGPNRFGPDPLGGDAHPVA